MFKGKIALITGASKGIGAAVAKRYAAEGAHVILVARSKRALERVDDAIREKGGTATLVPMDLSKPENIDLLSKSVYERFGKIDILVANAGILGSLTPMHQQTEKAWNEVLNINLTSNWHILRCFDALLRRSEAPRALFLTSDVAHTPHAYWGAYAVSKTALESMVKVYAAENEQTPIRANLVDPGAVATEMLKKAYPGRDMHQYASPDDITDVFVKLAANDLTATGQVFRAQS